MFMVSVGEESLWIWNSYFAQLLIWFGSAMNKDITFGVILVKNTDTDTDSPPANFLEHGVSDTNTNQQELYGKGGKVRVDCGQGVTA